MTTNSTSYKFDICPNYDELNDALTNGALCFHDMRIDASEGTP